MRGAGFPAPEFASVVMLAERIFRDPTVAHAEELGRVSSPMIAHPGLCAAGPRPDWATPQLQSSLRHPLSVAELRQDVPISDMGGRPGAEPSRYRMADG